MTRNWRIFLARIDVSGIMAFVAVYKAINVVQSRFVNISGLLIRLRCLPLDHDNSAYTVFSRRQSEFLTP